MQFSASRISVDFALEALGSRSVALQPPAPAMERDRVFAAEQFPLAENLEIISGRKGCIYYELGKGGAANAIFNNIDCEQSDAATNHGFVGNSSGTQIKILNWVFGCAPSNCGASHYGINLTAGNFAVDTFHIEQMQNGINVATTGTDNLSTIRNGTITSACVNSITLQNQLFERHRQWSHGRQQHDRAYQR